MARGELVEKGESKEEHHLSRYGVKKIADVDLKTTKYKYDLNEEKSDQHESRRLLEKVNEILKSCDEITDDTEDIKKKYSPDRKVDVHTKKEKRTTSIIDKSSETQPPRERSPSPWSRRRQRSRSYSPRGRTSPRNSPARFRRSRSRSPPRRWRPLWIAVSPLSLTEDVSLERSSRRRVVVRLKEEFSFPSNSGCRVKISKWSGRDCVNSVVVNTQILDLKDGHEVEVEIENPDQDRTLKLRKNDKIACLSILTSPVEGNVSPSSPDRHRSDTERWFRVTNAVLHRKGKLLSIRIPPQRSMKVIATLRGAVKKYVGKRNILGIRFDLNIN